MKGRITSLTISFLLVSCSPTATKDQSMANSNLPEFSELSWMWRSNTDVSCDCREKQNCGPEVILEEIPGNWDYQNELCEWVVENEIVQCHFESRFVELTGANFDEEIPGSWMKSSLNAKRIKMENGTESWCLKQKLN